MKPRRAFWSDFGTGAMAASSNETAIPLLFSERTYMRLALIKIYIFNRIHRRKHTGLECSLWEVFDDEFNN